MCAKIMGIFRMYKVFNKNISIISNYPFFMFKMAHIKRTFFAHPLFQDDI